MFMPFNNNEFKAQNAVIQKNKLELEKTIKKPRKKENPVKPAAPPRIPTVPTVFKPPTDLPEIIKPSAANPNRITDTGTGGLSEFQASKSSKHISGMDYNYLISWFKGNETKAQNAVIKLKEDKLREMIAAMKGWTGYVSGQLSGSETDFNPFDGATFIIGAGGNIVPGAGVSGDVDILMDLKGNVAVVRSGAVDYGLPAVSGGGRLGFSTADNVKDLYGTFIHGGASGGELGVFGVEASGSTSEGKLKNASLVGQVNVGGGSPFEVHGGAGNTEVIWEGTQKEFWEIVGNSIKDTWESIGEYPEDWPLDNYNGGFS